MWFNNNTYREDFKDCENYYWDMTFHVMLSRI